MIHEHTAIPAATRVSFGPLALAAVLAVSVVGCGTTDEASRETLPPLVTTTSTTVLDVVDPNEGKTEFYEIKSGDSLARIAAAFGVPASEIVRINNIENPDSIPVGLVIKIPTDIVLIEQLPEITTTSSTVAE